MEMLGRRAPVWWACVLLVAASATGWAREIHAPLDQPGDLFRQAALIAQVRLAGPWPSGHRREENGVWLAEVLDAAQGTTPGQLILVQRCDRDGNTIDFKPGDALILLASREVDGVYRPLAGQAGRWPIDRHGKLAPHPLDEQLSPAAATGRPADAIAWLSSIACQYDFAVSIALHQHDLRHYEQGKPLRLAIEIHNCGGHSLAMNNHIEFEHHDAWHDGLEEQRLAEKIEFSQPTVEVHVQPLSREHAQRALERARQSFDEFTLAAGQRCTADLDLGDEAQIYGGMRYQVWAEIGGRQSVPIVFTLPGSDEVLELREKLAELDDGGPFHLVEPKSGAQTTMPPVQPTDEAAAIDAAVNAWLAESTLDSNAAKDAADAPREVVLLSRAQLPLEFSSTSDRYRFVVAEPPVDRLKNPVIFKLQGETVKFNGRKLRVERVEIARQSAVVELGEVHHGRVGTTAMVRLRRTPSAWRLSGEIKLQHP